MAHQRVYTFDERTRQADFGFDLQYTPSAAPVADEDFVYFSMGDRVHAYFIPDFERIEKIRRLQENAKREGKELKLPPGTEYRAKSADSPQPAFLWGYRFADQFMTGSPLLYGERLSMLTTDGTLTGVERDGIGPRKAYYLPFKVNGRTPGVAGQHRNMAYVASTDFNLYAIDMTGGQLKWRSTCPGAPIFRGPDVNDNDVFLYPEGVGLRRIDRATGKEYWTNRDGQRFLAANDKYIYALDHVGKFFVIDGRRGSTLAKLDLSDWGMAIANEWTDRIYLAANDGQVLCLRHRDLNRAS